MSKTYKVPVKFEFSGTITVRASNPREAKEQAEKHFGLVIGGDLHTSSDAIIDWDFTVHPVKKVGDKVRRN